jgi:3-methyladenine DNA glycosylase AlkD
MVKVPKVIRAKEIASELTRAIRDLPVANAPSMRAVRREYSRKLSGASPEYILDLARALLREHRLRWVACELVRNHRGAFQNVGEAELEEFGRGMDSWGSVDTFARILAGPAWLRGQVSDGLIHKWARSDDRWWRRAALVSTVGLNVRSQGGKGDVPRTLEVCRMLVADRDDMVVKAMSWALRGLVVHDPDAVGGFLAEHEGVLAARVMREVRNKLATGLKNPRRSGVRAASDR